MDKAKAALDDLNEYLSSGDDIEWESLIGWLCRYKDVVRQALTQAASDDMRLPELPEGWEWINLRCWFSSGPDEHWEAIIYRHSDDTQIRAKGPTPREAANNAISKIKGE